MRWEKNTREWAEGAVKWTEGVKGWIAAVEEKKEVTSVKKKKGATSVEGKKWNEIKREITPSSHTYPVAAGILSAATLPFYGTL